MKKPAEGRQIPLERKKQYKDEVKKTISLKVIEVIKEWEEKL